LRKFSSALKIIISAAILLFLFRKANLTQGVHYLSEIRYPFVLLSIVLIVLAQIVRAHRLGVMVFGASANQKILHSLRVQMVSFLPGIISPAKIGEATKIYMLNSESNVPMGRGLACFVAERVLDLMLLGPLAAFGLYVFFQSGLNIALKSEAALMSILVLITGIGAFVAGAAWARRRGIELTELKKTISPERLIEASLMTVVYWGLVFLEVWCFCKASLFDPRVWHMTIVVPLALLTSMIPVSFSGFGLREAAMVILLQRPPIAASYDRALLVSLMYVFLGLGVPAVMGAFFWLTGKKDVIPQA
jgi:uncharacterized membrane protein YbhN (UPF0104 family)